MTIVLECHECGSMEDFESLSEVIDTDWHDVDPEGEEQDDGNTLHTGRCPIHADLSTFIDGTDDAPEQEEENDDRWHPHSGSLVEIAQADLPMVPRKEFETGVVYETDIDNQTIIRLAQSNRPRTMVEMMFQHTSMMPGGRYHICVYNDPAHNDESTFHLVEFDDGVFGVYPEVCLVPTAAEKFR